MRRARLLAIASVWAAIMSAGVLAAVLAAMLTRGECALHGFCRPPSRRHGGTVEAFFFTQTFPLLEFADGARTSGQLLYHTPGFADRLDAVNLRVRNCETVEQYAATYASAVVDSVPEDLRSKLQLCYETLIERAKGGILAYPLFWNASGTVFPERVFLALSTGTLAENGYAHTVGDTVVLPKSAVENKSPEALIVLLAHELTHVYQRFNPVATERILNQVYGFFKEEGGEEGRWILRANPDTNGHVYRMGSQSVNPVYRDDHPTSFSDIQFLPDQKYTAYPWVANPEHPYEVMAEHVASFFVDSRHMPRM